ncbi:MAG: metal-dependent transcriptional regulator [Chloroflexi bacterium]|nr:metal-dependent transcriptional regulator [Chloroflexota bacterium]
MANSKLPTPTIEDYLGIIYTLQRDHEEVYGARLAEILNVSPPTVTVTLQRMVRDKWITLDKNKKVHLTSSGLSAAHNIIRRHMLTEWMLAKILNLPWSEIHNEADKIEHTISSDVEKSLQATLNDPELCPHGNPMPGSENISRKWRSLPAFDAGTRVVIRRIHEFLEDDHELMKFLEKNKVTPGAFGEIQEILPFNSTITLTVDDHLVILGLDVAYSIFAEPI